MNRNKWLKVADLLLAEENAINAEIAELYRRSADEAVRSPLRSAADERQREVLTLRLMNKRQQCAAHADLGRQLGFDQAKE